MKYILALLIVLLLPGGATSQELNTFNINTYNGLPDNSIYWMIVDHHGYLWICTKAGVVQYNGYNCKLFGRSDRLPNEDVWSLCEDKKGRIWLSSISKKIGYIYNNQYYSAAIAGYSSTLFPLYVTPVNDGVSFTLSSAKPSVPAVFIEKNDTLFRYPVQAADSLNIAALIIVMPTGDYILSENNALRQLLPYTRNGKNYMQEIGDWKTVDPPMQFLKGKEILTNKYVVINKYIVSYFSNSQSPLFFLIDWKSGKSKTTNIDRQCSVNENIHHIYPGENKTFYVITESYVLKFDSNANYVNKLAIDHLIPGKGNGYKLQVFLQDKLWGNSMGTITDGVWINYNEENNFKKTKIDLFNFRYVGGIKDSLYFWWNPITAKIATIEKNNRVDYYPLDKQNQINSIARYNKDTFILSSVFPRFFVARLKKEIPIKKYIGTSVFNIIPDSKNSVFVVSRTGFFKVGLNGSDSIHYFDRERYEQLQYDSLRNSYWAYNSSSLYIHNDISDTKIEEEDIEKLGVKKINKIIFDNKYGNIFIKGYDNIIMYNYEKKTFTTLFAGYNLASASICMYNDLLIATGRFGVIFSKVLGRDKISGPITFQNIKDINYQYIFDWQVAWGKLLLNTDKGVYEVIVPDDSCFENQHLPSDLFLYKFIVSYRDTLRNITSGDTLCIDQKKMILQFDVINPRGNGNVKYKYKIPNNEWHDLNANELVLPSSFEPAGYYTLSVIASDNVWNSNEITLRLYIKPYWWQTPNGRKLVWAALIAVTLFLFSVAVLITRRLVLRTTRKRNMQMELELKAIYAQINPHFIFNSLNAALSLVRRKRLEEAYDHITQFSRLLRSYIRSSRNKFITIADEIVNLQDYLELQQARFVDKFDFSILVDESINAQNVKIPALLLQPFVENALNHGLLPKKGPGSLKIEFQKGSHKNEVICSIDDNGIGRKRLRLENNTTTGKTDSYGDILIDDLINIFNRYEQMNIKIKYIDKEEPLSGTIVMVYIKNPHYD